MRKNVAGQVVTAQLNALANGTPVASGSTTVTVIKDGVSAAGTGVVTHVAGGLWKYVPVQAETNASHLVFVFANVLAATQAPQMYTEVAITAESAIAVKVEVEKAGSKLSQVLADTATTIPSQISALHNFDPAVDRIARVTLVDTTTVNTDMRGTNSALTAAALPTNFKSMKIDVDGFTKAYTQGFLSTKLNETSAGRIALNLGVFFDNNNALTTKTVDAVGSAVAGGGEFTAGEKSQLRYRLGLDGAKAIPTSLADVARRADVTALHNFDPSSDTVARVTLVDTVTANSDMRGTDGANTTTPDNVMINAIHGNVATILADTTTDIPALINGLHNVSAVQLKAAMVASLTTDALAEPVSVPTANAPLAQKLSYLFAKAVNKEILTAAGNYSLRNGADSSNISTATVTSSGANTTRGEQS